MLLLYLILITFLIDGDNEFGNVCDELIAFSFPQRVHTHLEMFNQNLLSSVKKKYRFEAVFTVTV